MVIALAYHQLVSVDSLFTDIPRRFRLSLYAAEAESAALPNGVVHQPLVLAEHSAVKVYDDARLGGQILRKEIFKSALADKTDTG